MIRHVGQPETPPLTDQFGSFLLESLTASTQLRQEHIVETDGVRRIDFAEVRIQPLPLSDESEPENNADNANDDAVTTVPPPQLLARLEQDRHRKAPPTLQLVVLENNGDSASRIRFEHSSKGYVRSDSVLVREGPELKTVASTERVPAPITLDDFTFVVESLFSAQPTKITGPDTDYFLPPNPKNSRESWLARNLLRRRGI